MPLLLANDAADGLVSVAVGATAGVDDEDDRCCCEPGRLGGGAGALLALELLLPLPELLPSVGTGTLSERERTESMDERGGGSGGSTMASAAPLLLWDVCPW